MQFSAQFPTGLIIIEHRPKKRRVVVIPGYGFAIALRRELQGLFRTAAVNACGAGHAQDKTLKLLCKPLNNQRGA
jgi:hypothetical protein